MATYRYKGLDFDAEFEVELELSWELDGDSITDDYLPEETSAEELWDLWIERYGRDSMPISWFVRSRGDKVGHFEFAPPSLIPQVKDLGTDGDRGFLAYFSHPEDPETGEPLRWTRLPVVDRLWEGSRADKGGFIQQATGWKPSPLQTHADVRIIAQAAGLRTP